MKDTAVVIHWWNDNVNVKPFLDPFNPVVLTVATIRSNNPTLPIYVIDASSCIRPDSDWLYYPNKLDFRVIKVDAYLRELQDKFQGLYNVRLFSRVWDVEMAMRDVPENIIIFVDADIFCLNPLQPVGRTGKPLEYFYANKNNGIWVYDKRSISSKLVFDMWKGMICRAFHDADFRREIYQSNPGYGTYVMQDEIVYRTMLWRMQNHVRAVPHEDNFLFYWLYKEEPQVIEQIRGLHCLSFVTGSDRRKLFLIIRELWDQIIRVLDHYDVKTIFEGALPVEFISIKDFYFNEETIDRFAKLASVHASSIRNFTRNMKQDDKFCLRLL